MDAAAQEVAWCAHLYIHKCWHHHYTQALQKSLADGQTLPTDCVLTLHPSVQADKQENWHLSNANVRCGTS